MFSNKQFLFVIRRECMRVSALLLICAAQRWQAMWRALQNNNDRVMEGQHGRSLSSGEKPEASAGS